MKVLQVNKFDIRYGAGRAAYRLHSRLRAAGLQSEYFVMRKESDDSSIFKPETDCDRLLAVMSSPLDSLPLRRYRHRGSGFWSVNWFRNGFDKYIRQSGADIINLHWIGGGFLQIASLGSIPQPLVWTMHDSWAFTGGCHVPGDCERYRDACGACPQLGSGMMHDLSHAGFRRKQKVWGRVAMTIVAPSTWLASRLRSSRLLADKRIEVIPNGIDTDVYRPIEKKEARGLLSLPQDATLILSGAVSVYTDRNKGFHLAAEAVRHMTGKKLLPKAELILFGASAPRDVPDLGLRTRFMGHLYDDISLALLYSAADVFIAPSLQENLPNTVMEAMSCGTPCVAFDIGGMPDLIVPGKTGYLARPFEAEDFAQGIAWIICNRERHDMLSRESRAKILRGFSIEDISQRYIDLYREIITT